MMSYYDKWTVLKPKCLLEHKEQLMFTRAYSPNGLRGPTANRPRKCICEPTAQIYVSVGCDLSHDSHYIVTPVHL